MIRWPHLPALGSRTSREAVTTSQGMATWMLWSLTCTLLYLQLVHAEYKICATSDDKARHKCDKLEATRPEFRCVLVQDSVDCALKLDRGEVDIAAFSPEQALLTSQLLSDSVEIVAELRNKQRPSDVFEFQTVVLVKAELSLVGGLKGLRGKKYCHPGFSRNMYWTDRVQKYFEWKVLESLKEEFPTKCDLHNANEDELARLTQVFTKGCRPGSWTQLNKMDEKMKKNFTSLCSLCDHPGNCSYSEQIPASSLKCLTQGQGDVAYTSLDVVQKYFHLDGSSSSAESTVNASEFRFLCPDGSTRTLASSDPCAWIKQPLGIVVSHKSQSANVLRDFNEWLTKSESWTSSLKEVLTTGDNDIKPVTQVTPLKTYVQKDLVRPPCLREIRWCTVNATELRKCDFIRAAVSTHGVPGQLKCVGASSQAECLAKVKKGDADIVVVDTELGYVARNVYNLSAVMVMGNKRANNYYGVAVVKKGSVKSLKDLKGKKACFPQYNGRGWLSFVDVATKQNLVPEKLCSDSRSVWEFFDKACAPGAKSPEINPRHGITPQKYCATCSDKGPGSPCAPVSSTPYYGEIGALKCLNDDKGDVAFLDFKQIKDFFATGQNKTDEDDMIDQDQFQILCLNGTVKDFTLTDPSTCALSQFTAAEILTRADLAKHIRRDIQMTLGDIDDWFGFDSREYNAVLKIYEPFDGQNNVIFKDSSILMVHPRDSSTPYITSYMALHKKLAPGACAKDNAAGTVVSSGFLLLLSIVLLLVGEK